jgi:adenosylcobinamide kinase/adenosylcobinamide-phosphate guanylyltransferase
MALILVGGGSRSGKSSFAVELARRRGARLAFVATAQPLDTEMERRIAQHRAERGAEFTTIEEPFDLAMVIGIESHRFDALVVDCLTLWLSNLLLRDEPDAEERGLAVVQAAASAGAPCILVTNEVGCGIVPDNALARRFRDLAGRLNQQAAHAAEEVYLLHFGIASRLK